MFARVIATLLASVSLLAQTPSPPPPAPASTLTANEESADVALLRRAYERVHPGLYRYESKAAIDAAFDRLAAFAAVPHEPLALYGAISETLATIHCDHTKAEYPAATEAFREREPTFFPFRFRLFAGRMYVASSDPRQPPLPRGSEVLAIDGRPVRDVIARLAKAVAYDGFTSQAVASKLEADADLMGSDFEQFYPVFYGFAPERRLALRAPGSTLTTVLTLHCISYADWNALPWPALAYHSQLVNGTSWRLLNAQTAYLRVDSFVNYREQVDAQSFYAAFFKPIDASGARRLIVDLRWNSGGSTDATIALARFLMSGRFVWNAPLRVKTLDFGDLPAFAQTWGDQSAFFHPDPRGYRKLPDGTYEMIPGSSHGEQDAEMLPIDVAPERFPGDVIILSGPRNASGATMLISKLHDAERVRIVGQPTGGSAEGPTAGFILFLKLPKSGITVRVPDMWNRMAVGPTRYGYGVAPDVPVTPDLADFLNGRDPELEAAIALPPPAPSGV